VKALNRPAAVMALISSEVHLNHFDIYFSPLANDSNVKKAVIIQPFCTTSMARMKKMPHF
jgi:hypothetical protein